MNDWLPTLQNSMHKHSRIFFYTFRPLIKEMIEYARMDTHYLLHIYDLQKKALLDMNDRNFLFQAYQNSKSTCLIVSSVILIFCFYQMATVWAHWLFSAI